MTLTTAFIILSFILFVAICLIIRQPTTIGWILKVGSAILAAFALYLIITGRLLG